MLSLAYERSLTREDVPDLAHSVYWGLVETVEGFEVCDVCVEVSRGQKQPIQKGC